MPRDHLRPGHCGSDRMVETAILGGGIAGLGAAHAALGEGTAATVFEAKARPGGWLDNIIVDGFVFDTAVHLSFASEPEVREVFDRTPFVTHAPPVSLCWDSGYWLKHPVQTNMAPLPLRDKTELIAGLARNRARKILNYRDWLIHQYGRPIAERWPIAYTEKYWTVPPERLGVDWIGQRLRRATLEEIIAGAISSETPNHYYVTEMRYPDKCGYRSFIEPLIKKPKILSNHEAVELCPSKRAVRFRNGSAATYSNLIFTIPLPRVIDIIPSLP